MKTWYAVMKDHEDNDWGIGSTRKRDAIRMVRELRRLGFTDAYIVVIDDGACPVAVGEITEF